MPIEKKLICKPVPPSREDTGIPPDVDLAVWETVLNGPLADYHVAQLVHVDGVLWCILEKDVP